MHPQPPISNERLLLQDCLAGDPDAWRTLFDHYRGALAFVVARRLGTSARRDDRVDEILAEFWLALWKNHHRVLRSFDPQRGSLMTYLTLLACHQAGYFLERQSRRQQYQVHLTAGRLARLAVTGSAVLVNELWEALWASLTPRVEQFLHDWLDAEAAAEPGQQPPSASQRKAKQRVREKLYLLLDAAGAA